MHRILRHIELLRDKVTDWKAYPFTIPAVANLERLEFNRGVTFLVGENGSGKSTLVEAIAIKVGFNPEGGSKNFRSSHRPSESCLHDYLRMARGATRERGGFFLRAETMFNVSTEAEGYGLLGWEDLHEMSHGEAFLWVAMNRFHGKGLYILDEPEAALSPARQLALLGRIHQLVRGGAQLIIATHSPILMAYPGATIFLLAPDGIREVRYEDTEHYAVTKMFLADPSRVAGDLRGGRGCRRRAVRLTWLVWFGPTSGAEHMTSHEEPACVDDLVRSIEAGLEPDYLFFWGHTSKGRGLGKECLSQWYPTSFIVDGNTFPTAEHYMMWSKAMLFADGAAAERILAAAEPGAAKQLGRGVRGFDEDELEAHRFRIVVDGSIAKFSQNEELRAFLLGTKQRILVEASPRDTIWGIGMGETNEHARRPSQWRGLNLLGFALMVARARLRSGVGAV